MVTIRPYTNRAAEQAMRQNRRQKNSRDESSAQGDDAHVFRGRRRSKPQHIIRDKHHGGFSHHRYQGKIVEAQAVQNTKDDQSINDDIARGESIDSVEMSESQIAEPSVQSPVSSQSWVRLYNPLASYFPDNDTEDENELDLQDGEEDMYGLSCDHEAESTPWWEQDLSYFNDYRTYNWGAAAMREANLDVLREAADSMWARKTPRPIHIPKPVIRPEPGE